MITVRKLPTADDVPRSEWTRDMILQASTIHIKDMMRVMQFLRGMIDNAAVWHDVDKLLHVDQFVAFLKGDKDSGWMEAHARRNRHHLDHPAGVPVDVNLIDVLEYIGDCIASGMERRGHVYRVGIDAEVLVNAFNNTVRMLIENIKVEE